MLTLKQQRFVDEFALDHNASRAARAAGYAAASAKVTASRLLTKANVRAAVTVREQEAERDLRMTRERVLRGMQEAFELARARREPMAMIAACRAIATLCGYYEKGRRPDDLPALGTDARRLEALSDRELMAIVSEGA